MPGTAALSTAVIGKQHCLPNVAGGCIALFAFHIRKRDEMKSAFIILMAN